ncbi:MAG: apolipoprotein N-acyltransferase, partial [Candidatus Omnitrophota bacterium]
NYALKEFLGEKISRAKNIGRDSKPVVIVLACLIAVVLGYGAFQLSQVRESPQVSVVAVQGNVPQEVKWDRMAWPLIMERYLSLTEQAAAEGPDIIIWPETAFPGFLWESADLWGQLDAFVVEMKTPLLVGVVTREAGAYFNSALLIPARGGIAGQYHKLHLVPFGEYVPLRGKFPFLTDIIPIDDFTPGREHTLFGVGERENGIGEKGFFSVLICFEDGVAEISREFVRRGANFLVNITNDAWFGDTKAPFMHLQSSVFRAVENRRSLIRAANTGVSCSIDPRGRIVGFVENARGKKTFVPGYVLDGGVQLSREKTLYTKFGDFFTYLCFGCILHWIVSRAISVFYRSRGRAG